MGRAVIPQTPRALPTKADIKAAEKRAKKAGITIAALRVAGSRAQTRSANAKPDFATHGQPRLVNVAPADFTGKHLIVFLHGYNVTDTEALDSAFGFFGRLQDSLVREGANPSHYTFLLFTWPGDTGVVYFNSAQKFAHHSGVALYELLRSLQNTSKPASISIAAHSLGAHVALRAASVLGGRRVDAKANFRIDRALLMGAAVEDDVFERVDGETREYHFPESAFGIEKLHITISRGDEILASAFRINEADRALGLNGPPTMDPLVSLSRRHAALFPGEAPFTFRLHDLSPNSSTAMNPELAADSHGDYWAKPIQLDYYVNHLR